MVDIVNFWILKESLPSPEIFSSCFRFTNPLYYLRAIFTHSIQFRFTYNMIYTGIAKVTDTDDKNLLELVDALKVKL